MPYDPAIPLLGIHTEKTRRERDAALNWEGPQGGNGVHVALSGAGTFPTLMPLERAGLEMRGRMAGTAKADLAGWHLWRASH